MWCLLNRKLANTEGHSLGHCGIECALNSMWSACRKICDRTFVCITARLSYWFRLKSYLDMSPNDLPQVFPVPRYMWDPVATGLSSPAGSRATSRVCIFLRPFRSLPSPPSFGCTILDLFLHTFRVRVHLFRWFCCLAEMSKSIVSRLMFQINISGESQLVHMTEHKVRSHSLSFVAV
jgi:hypothetical protein